MSRVWLPIFALFIGSAEARACRCDLASPRAAAARSSQVYLGRVVSLGGSRGEGFDALRSARLLVTLPVKGATAADTVSVTFPDNSCGPGFAVGKEYLVYARRGAATGEEYTSHCAGTKPIRCAADDLQALAVSVPERATSCGPTEPTGNDRDRPREASLQFTELASARTDWEMAMETNEMQDPPSGLDCPECGAPLRRVREAATPGTEARAVFRCANAHTVVVQLVAEYDDEPAVG